MKFYLALLLQFKYALMRRSWRRAWSEVVTIMWDGDGRLPIFVKQSNRHSRVIMQIKQCVTQRLVINQTNLSRRDSSHAAYLVAHADNHTHRAIMLISISVVGVLPAEQGKALILDAPYIICAQGLLH